MRQLVLHPLAPLVAFSLVLAAVFSSYLIAGFTPSHRIEVVGGLIWSLLLPLWIVADARRRNRIPCFDFGFLCYLFLPLAAPWYCLWSRGWPGVLTLLLLVALWLAPYVVATMVWQVMYGR